MTKVRRRVRVTGVVQGVSYRYYTQREAGRLGLTGWVRNEPDGSVSMEVQGIDGDVEAIIDWARRGPRHAKVARVVVESIEVDETDTRFRVTG